MPHIAVLAVRSPPSCPKPAPRQTSDVHSPGPSPLGPPGRFLRPELGRTVEGALVPDLLDRHREPPALALDLDPEQAAAWHELDDQRLATAKVDLGGLAGHMSIDGDHGIHS